jgi:pimeloyl-ACP methyl ester carboxylesterase
MAQWKSRFVVAILFAVCLSAAPIAATQFMTGSTGPGSEYALAVPDTWNGELIVYGHGIVDPSAAVALPTTQDGFAAMRDAMLARGYAVAYSSYSENGYALKDAALRLHQLSGLFAAQFGQPTRTYLVGHSLGATAVQTLAERFPGQYDGTLAMCGLLGGAIPEVQYLGHVRALFDAYFPGVLPGDLLNVPTASWRPGDPLFMPVLGALQQGFVTPGTPTLAFAIAARLPFTSAPELVAAAMNALGFNIRFTNDLLEHTHGHSFFDNMTTTYPSSVDALVRRYAAAPDAVNYLQHYYTPTGTISSPMVTLHTTRDPVVPLFHESIYGSLAPADWLVQRTVDRFGHCAFNQQEVLTAFDDLVRWVNEGVRPSGGDATIR